MPSIEPATQVAIHTGRKNQFSNTVNSKSKCSKQVRLPEYHWDKKTDVRLLSAPPPVPNIENTETRQKTTPQSDLSFVHTDSGMNLNRNPKSCHQQEHPLRSPPEHMTEVEPIYQNTHLPQPAQAPDVKLPEPESLTLSDSDFGDFVSGMIPLEQPRVRSSSFTCRRNQTQQQPYHNPIAHMMPRLDESKLGRAGSADNLVYNQHNHSSALVHPSLRLTHSHTLSEIPHKHALSNDSGYDTPPVQPRPRTSEAWPNNQHPQWSRSTAQSHASSQPQHSSLPSGPLHLELPSMSRSQVPTNQALTIDVEGHFLEENESGPLTLSIADPRSHYGYSAHGASSTSAANHSFRGVDPRYSFSTQRSMTISQEESIIGYQRERKERLELAYQQEQAELESLEQQTVKLQQQLQSHFTQDTVDKSTEREVENLRKENYNLKREISILDDAIRQGNEARVRRQTQTPPIRPPPPQSPQTPQTTTATPQVTFPQEEPMWACPSCTYCNNALINSCEMCDTPRPMRRGLR